MRSLANPGKYRYFSAPGENVLVQKTLTRDWQQLTALRTKPLTDKAMESFQLLASYDGCFLDLAACGRDFPRVSKTIVVSGGVGRSSSTVRLSGRCEAL